MTNFLILPTEQCKKNKAARSRLGTLYGLCKVHQALLMFDLHLDLYLLQWELLVTNLLIF